MKFTLLASAIAFACTAFASPPSYGHQKCLTQHQATSIVNKVISVLQHAEGANATAQELLSDNFYEYSDSILSLQSLPLGGPTADKQEWINGLLSNPPNNAIDTFLLAPTDCNKIIWFWQFNAVARATYPVKGFNLFTVNKKLQITRLDLEFNSIAWGLDDGELPCNFTAKH